MRNNEKFMFDTIFDELEPILPEVAEEDQLAASENEEQREPETEETPLRTYNEADIAAARQEGFEDGKKQGTSEALTGIEKTLIDTLTAITKNLSNFQSEQIQANQEITDHATTLALTIVRKFFPKLNEQTALDEINSVTVKVLSRLIGEPLITIKVNPSISSDLSEKLKHEFNENDPSRSLSVIADENVDEGDCKIEWSNGAAERNLDMLMHEIDDIIMQNSTKEIGSLTPIAEKNEAVSHNSINDEKNNNFSEK